MNLVFGSNSKIEYNGIKYSVSDVIKEIYKYGYVKSIVRSDKYAWVKKRKKLYATESMLEIFKIKLSSCNKLFKHINHEYVLGMNYGKNNSILIEDGIYDENTIIKKDKIESLDMITKDIYKKFMYPNKIIASTPCEMIRKRQNLSYNLILPEHHYSYDLFHKEITTSNNTNIYKDIVEMLDYYVPEGEDYKEFCYLLLGEDITEDYVNQLLGDSESQPIFYYGKFGGSDDTRRKR